jgi:hypothetical protein
MTPSNDFLKNINLSTEIYERLLIKISSSVALLKDALYARNSLIYHNRAYPRHIQRSNYVEAYKYHYYIKNCIAEIRFYKGYLHTISLLEASYERELRRDW